MLKHIIEFESNYLSPYACKSVNSQGRAVVEPECAIRTVFQRDRDRIIHCKSFRRLKHKTQVFLAPSGDHYRTRLTHTLEVMQVARTIARALRLNEDLTEAISLGHDLGHTPFGHSGEKILNELNPNGFTHNEHSLRVVDCLENDGQGLNLTYEVRDGILHHKKSGTPSTLEGKIVSYADRIAYVNHDIEDAITAGILLEEDLPKDISELLGNTKRDRINSLIYDIVNNSINKSQIALSNDYEIALNALRSFMFERVYINSEAKTEEIKANRMISGLYNYFKENPLLLPSFYISNIDKYGIDNSISDYIASMTDRFAIEAFGNIFIPKSWRD